MKIGRIVVFWFFTIGMACSPKKQDNSIRLLDNGIYTVRNNVLVFLIDPNLGARVVSATYDGKEVLLQKREKLMNWGATFWPSPQSNWNWPPPYAIQFGPYQGSIQENKLVLQSQTDQKMGLKVKKVFWINEEKNCLEIEYEITNDTDSVLQVGPWEIVCVPAVGAKVFFALGTSPDDVDNTLEFGQKDGIGWFDFDSDNLDANHKLFNNAREGWLGHINQNRVLFIKTFDVIPTDDLPPGQGNVEVYVSKPFEYIELENHGKYETLKPGQSLQYNIQWYLSELPKEFSDVIFSAKLLHHVKSVIQ